MDHRFIFAKDGGYAVAGSGYFIGKGLPEYCVEILQKSAETYCFAFGPGDATVVTYLDKQSGKIQLEMRNLASMQGLAAYLLERNPLQGFVRDLRRLQVSFGGRDGSYWASDGQTSMSNELPDKLEQDLRNLQLPGGAWLTKPRLVALGVDDNYVLLTTSGPFSSQLRAYPKVFAALDGMSSVPGGVDQIQNISLCCFFPDSAAVTIRGIIHPFQLRAEATRDIEVLNRHTQTAYIRAQQQEAARNAMLTQSMGQLHLVQHGILQAQMAQQAIFAQQEASLQSMCAQQLANADYNAEMSARAGGAIWVRKEV